MSPPHDNAAALKFNPPGKPGGGGGGGRGVQAAESRDWGHLAKLFESLPPHALEAEMSLLGSILIDAQVLGDLIFIVKSGEAFFKPAHGAIFDAMIYLYDRHSSVDIVQLNQILVDRNVLEAVGGVAYLVELANSVPSASNAVHYARLVREKAVVRQLIGAAGDILHTAYHSPENATVILNEAEKAIFKIAEQSEQTQIEALQDLIRQTMEHIDANLGREFYGLPTGFIELDEMTTGLQNGEMLIIAARPSMGKTALALNIMEAIAIRGRPVGLFSLEMGKQQLVQRMLCARSGIDAQRLRRNMLKEQEYSALMAACDELQAAPIYIDDTGGLTLMQLRTKARRMVAKHKVQALFVDYLQLMSAGGRVESRQLEVSEISRSVKALARELNIPIICLSQLNRAAEQREGHKPRMSDLRESGSLEQDADVIMLLHREEYYHKDDPSWADEHPEDVGVAEIILTKQRNGPTGLVKLSWHAASTRFRDYTSMRPQAGYAEPKYVPEPPRRAASAPAASFPSSAAPAEAPPFAVGGGSGAGAGSSSGGGSGGSSAFAGRKTGPVADFRDGGGPDLDEEDYDGIPI